MISINGERVMAGQYKATDKLSYVISNDYRLLQIMSRFGISLGFGEKTIYDVCRQCGVDAETFLLVINYVKDGAENRPQHIENVDVKSLLLYLRNTHKYFLDYLLPNIRFNLLNAIDCSVQNEVAFLVLKFFDEYVEEVRMHMNFEEEITFSAAQKIINGESVALENSQLLGRYHEHVGDKLNELKNLFMQYYPAKHNDERLNSVIISIYQAEEDMSIHCLVEDNLFIPAVKRLNQHNHQQSKDHELDVTEEIHHEDQLSQREKEVVACVAKGMANKEIADFLCLSVNTVTTHRRNIARKLSIHSPAGITIYAIVNKLVTIEEVSL